jgi:hypothetical protein
VVKPLGIPSRQLLERITNRRFVHDARVVCLAIIVEATKDAIQDITQRAFKRLIAH